MKSWVKSWVPAVTDVVAIVVFAAIGRASHTESSGLLGLLQTAWPFLAGWAVGAVIMRYGRRPSALSTGLGVWIGAVAGGMVLRAVSGAGVQLSFVVVASIALAVLLLGWRLVLLLVSRRRTPAPG